MMRVIWLRAEQIAFCKSLEGWLQPQETSSNLTMAHDVARTILDMARHQHEAEQQQQMSQRRYTVDVMRPSAQAVVPVASLELAFDSKQRVYFAHRAGHDRKEVSYSRTVVLPDAAAEMYALRAFLSDLDRIAQSRGLLAPVYNKGRWETSCGFKLVLRCRDDLASEIVSKVCRRRSWAALRKDLAAMLEFARKLRLPSGL